MIEKEEKLGCSKREYIVTAKDLPLSCPPKNERIWDAHPRIYLPITDTGTALCSYCGTQFYLQDFVSPAES